MISIKTINSDISWVHFKKKKKTIFYLISGILIIAAIGTITYFAWPKNKLTENKEPTSSNQQIQQLKTELNSLKSKLNNLSDTNQKTQLETKLSSLESQINNLSQPNTTLKKLEQEIKQIQQELGKEPDKPNSPTDPNQLQFTVFYYVELGQNHMWIDYDTKSDKIILIDKENSIFPNSELTKKNHNYTIAFSVQDAEKFPDTHDHVYYFSKNNNKFSLVPVSTPTDNPNDKNEWKLCYMGIGSNDIARKKYAVFSNNILFLNSPEEVDMKVFYINKNHPRIKELLSKTKLQKDKLFIIRYGKKLSNKTRHFFEENDQDLEILEYRE